MSSNAMLNIAVKAARAACTIITRASENLDAIEVHSKAPSDFVSKVDVDCESAIIEILQHAYPHHQILTEEQISRLQTVVSMSPSAVSAPMTTPSTPSCLQVRMSCSMQATSYSL